MIITIKETLEVATHIELAPCFRCGGARLILRTRIADDDDEHFEASITCTTCDLRLGPDGGYESEHCYRDTEAQAEFAIAKKWNKRK